GQILFSLASQVALLAMAGSVVWLAVTGAVSIPQSIALIVVIVRYLEPFTVLAELSGGVESATGVLRTLRTVLDAPLVPAGSREWVADGAAGVELQGIGFAYGEDLPRVLNGLDLTLEPGSTTAIVGPSGSGKSTLLSLLAGLHTPTEGSIVVGGVDVATLDADSRRGLVSVVFQQPYLFDGTIEENIRAGHAEADDDTLAAAARLAQVDSILGRVPGGWDARVGEGGSTLSGGERQRVSIARALLKPAPLLLVDEATSALDAENETAIAAALTGDPRPRTRVIVAHRLTSIQTADRVLFMEDGRIVEDGTVDELRMKGGRFSAFLRHQSEATTWRLGM
ncbi:MAG: ABC transporter ATP-binding protein/permease, partial [Ruaniaceae bacterium]|nr:ABC transporter ATP-binding protein/permease [Ruaniaceae bacterium]